MADMKTFNEFLTEAKEVNPAAHVMELFGNPRAQKVDYSKSQLGSKSAAYLVSKAWSKSNRHNISDVLKKDGWKLADHDWTDRFQETLFTKGTEKLVVRNDTILDGKGSTNTYFIYAEGTFSDTNLKYLPGRQTSSSNSFDDKQTKVYDMYNDALINYIDPVKSKKIAYTLAKNGYSNIESVKKIVNSYVDDNLTKNIMASIKSIHPSIKLLQR